jgi:16S rRNA C1402 (ribose-2'-O) methylase RsmI
MDTPYRLKRLLEEFRDVWGASKHKKEIFLALSLGEAAETLLLGNPDYLLQKLIEFKQEFVMVVS